MRILIRPGLVLVGGLLLIGGLLTLINWRIAQRSALSRAAYYEQRAQGVQQHAGSLEAQLEVLLAERVALSNQVAELDTRFQAERAANDPLREEVKTQLAARIGQQSQLETQQRRQAELRDRVRELESTLTERDKALAAALKTVGEHEKLQAEHRALGERVAKLESDLQAAVRDRERLQKEQQEQRTETEALRTKLRDTEAALKARDATLAELRAAAPESGP